MSVCVCVSNRICLNVPNVYILFRMYVYQWPNMNT